MIKSGHSILVVGPSGSGKSSLARDALLSEGTGIVVMAPGSDEAMSYVEFGEALEDYAIEGFASPETSIAWLKPLYTLNAAHVKEHGKPFHKVIVQDTLSGFDQVIRAKRIGAASTPPKARTQEGFAYYSGIQTDWERQMRVVRAFRDLGMHWIALCHSKIRITDEDSLSGDGLTAEETVQPLITGASRDMIPQIFDLVVHSFTMRGADKQVHHVMQWVTDPKKITKSRVGALSDGKVIENYWRPTVELVEKAIEARKIDFRARRAAQKEEKQ